MRWLAILALVLVACNPWAAAWKGIGAVQSAGNLADQALGDAAAAKHVECVKAHGAGTAQYASCIESHYKAMKIWVEYAKPAINSAIKSAVLALQVAEKVKDKKVDWLALIKPAVCTLATIVEQWKHLMKEAIRKQVEAYLKMIKGITCSSGAKSCRPKPQLIALYLRRMQEVIHGG